MAKASKFPDYKTVSTDSLIPYARNARTHSDAQVAKIAASIAEFGFMNPIISVPPKMAEVVARAVCNQWLGAKQ